MPETTEEKKSRLQPGSITANAGFGSALTSNDLAERTIHRRAVEAVI